jgi:hypothetical protein
MDHLAVHDQYQGNDMVQVGNGAGLKIMHIGSCSINSDTCPLLLIVSFMFPKFLNTCFLSINYLMIIMSSLNFIFGIFFIKDQATRNLLEGKCESVLYPLKASNIEFIKQAFVSSSARLNQWHARFDHPSPQVCLISFVSS